MFPATLSGVALGEVSSLFFAFIGEINIMYDTSSCQPESLFYIFFCPSFGVSVPGRLVVMV